MMLLINLQVLFSQSVIYLEGQTLDVSGDTIFIYNTNLNNEVHFDIINNTGTGQDWRITLNKLSTANGWGDNFIVASEGDIFGGTNYNSTPNTYFTTPWQNTVTVPNGSHLNLDLFVDAALCSPDTVQYRFYYSLDGTTFIDSVDVVVGYDGPGPTSSSITEIACHQYISNEGNTYYTSGLYFEYSINSTGCDSIIILDLTINTNTNVTQTDSVLTAEEIGATYQWLNCGSSYDIIIGETNQSFTPSITGNYAVEVNVNGCVDTSACFLVDYTGIVELSQGEKELVKVIDLMGRETTPQKNRILIYVFSDGTIERIFAFE